MGHLWQYYWVPQPQGTSPHTLELKVTLHATYPTEGTTTCPIDSWHPTKSLLPPAQDFHLYDGEQSGWQSSKQASDEPT